MPWDFKSWLDGLPPAAEEEVPQRPAPGKVSRTSRLQPVQRRAASGSVSAAPLDGIDYLSQPAERQVAPVPHEDPFAMHLIGTPVQRSRDGANADDVHAAAARGLEAPASPLPHLDQIQKSFGHHDISHVQAHVGGAAAEASTAMGASAYAAGDDVAFASAPDLHTAAHEAAHVVQQKGGVQLKGGVGEVGDAYERHADAVADKVVAGESAEVLLDQFVGAGSHVASAHVQRKNIGGTGEGREDSPSDVSADRFRFEAERSGALVTAREYLRGYLLTKIGPALSAAMADKGYSPPHRRLGWGEKASDFGYEVVARIPDVFSDDYHGLPDLLGDELWQLVDDNRLRTTDGKSLADKVMPAAPKEGLKDGIKGPMRWVPDVAVAIASRFDEQVRASLPRVGERYVQAYDRFAADAAGAHQRAVKSSDILPGHPMDRLVIRVMSTEGMVTVEPRHDAHGASAERGTRGPRRLKSMTWVDEPGMWNWIKVSPADATAEEVAYHLFKDYSAAHRLVASPPFFGLTIKDAAQFPAARAHRAKHDGGNAFDAMDAAANESPDLTRTRAEQTQDPAHDRPAQLVNSKAGEEASRAHGTRSGASQPSATEADATDVTAPRETTDPVQTFAAVLVQLEAIARMVVSFGAAGELAPVHERTVARRSQAASAPPELRAQLSGVARAQQRVLLEIGSPLGQVVVQLQARGIKATDKDGAGDVARSAVVGLVRAAAFSDLPDLARTELEGALKAQRLAGTDAMEAMLADAIGRVESITMQRGKVAYESKRSEKVFDGDLQGRQRALRAKVAELRGRLIAGEAVAPSEVKAIFEKIDALRFEAELMTNIVSLESMFEAVQQTLDEGWVRAAENTPGMGTNLASLEEGGARLKSTLTHAHKRWLEIHAELRAMKQADPERAADLNHALDDLKSKVRALAGDKAVADYLNMAYDRMSDARTKAAIVQIAFFIGVSIVAAGAGGFVAAGVNAARGAETAALLGQLAGMTVESTIVAGANAATSDGSFGTEFASDFVGNLVTFGALRGVDKAVEGTKMARIAKNVEHAPAELKLAYKTMHAGLTGATILGTQAFSMQADAAIHGRSLSLDEMAEGGPKVLGMMIGHSVAGRLMSGPMEELKALGAKGGEFIRRRQKLADRAQILRKTGDPDGAIRLLADERALYEAEVAFFRAELAKKGGFDAELNERIKGSTERLGDVGAEQAGHAFAQMHLEPVVPGHSYTGSPSHIDGVVAHYRGLGFKATEYADGAGEGKRLIELTSPTKETTLELLDKAPRRGAKSRTSGADDEGRTGGKDPQGIDSNRDPFAPDEVRKNADIIRAGEPGLNAVVGFVTKDTDGLALLQRLMRGDETALAELGFEGNGKFDPSTREWGLGKFGKKYVIVAGEPSGVDWGALKGVEPIGHSHPIDMYRKTMQGRRQLDIRSVVAESGEDASLVFSSPEDVRFAALRRLGLHVIALPYEHLGGTEITLASKTPSGRAQVILLLEGATGPIHSADGATRYRARATMKAGGQPIWQGTIDAVFPAGKKSHLEFDAPEPASTHADGGPGAPATTKTRSGGTADELDGRDLVDLIDGNKSKRARSAEDSADDVDDGVEQTVREADLPARHRDLMEGNKNGVTVRTHGDAKQSGIVPGPGELNTEQHHVFPKESQYAKFFKDRSLDENKIHDYTISIDEHTHELVHVGRDKWDQEWSAAIIKRIADEEKIYGRLLTVDEMVGTARDLMADWRIPRDLPFERWNGAPASKAPPPKRKKPMKRTQP